MTKVSVKEALEKLYNLSWMIGSTSVEHLTDKDGEKIRDYIGVIEARIDDLEKELSEFKKYFEPYDIDEETAEAIIRSKCPNINSAKDYIQSQLAYDTVEYGQEHPEWAEKIIEKFSKKN